MIVYRSNPLCQKHLLISCKSLCHSKPASWLTETYLAGTKNVTAAIVDFFVADAPLNVGLSPTAFEMFAPLDDGIVPNVIWSVV